MRPQAPNSFETALQAALVHHREGRLPDACAAYRALRVRAPRDARVLHLGGVALLQTQQPAEAVAWLEAAAKLAPQLGSTQMCLGVALGQLGRHDAAEAALRRATRLEPANGEAWTNFGLALGRTGKAVESLDALRRGAEARPRDPAGWTAWGQSLLVAGRAGEALAVLDKASSALGAEAGAELHAARGACLHGLGRMPEALAAFDTARRIAPAHLTASSQRLLVLHYIDELPVAELTRAHLEFGRDLRARLGPTRPLPPPVTDGPLRVGFLSPDLREHAVAHFLEPLLPALGPAGFEVYFYQNHPVEDAVSTRLRVFARAWRNVSGLTDEAATELVRRDGLHLLVDLAGHTGHSRPELFARRAAPVQVTYLGYPNGTGLDSADFRFTDAIADPPGLTEAHGLEKIIRFSSCAWCYRPPADASEPLPPPASLDPHQPIVFGSFNHLGKLSPATWALWGRVLAAVPNSRLLLKGSPPDPDWPARPAREAGIDPSRVELLPFMASRAEHFASYARMDIALDPVPYHGTTTTCEALWMGRPVVTLAGDRHVRRVGASLLTAIGETDCVCATEDEYVEVAVRLASDRSALAERAGRLRGAMLQSALGDAEGQGKAFAEALRSCWLNRTQ